MRAIGKAFQNMRRTPYQSISAILVLTNTFFMSILVAFAIIALRQSLAYFETQPQMLVFFNPSTPESSILSLKAELDQRPETIDVIYVSQEEALLKYQEANQDDPQLLELVTADILPPSLEISTALIDSLQIIKLELEDNQDIDEIALPEDVIDRLKTVLAGVRLAGGGFVGVMVLTSFLIISVVVGMKIANRQFEIKVMRLMGASSWFVQGPYLFEGAFYGLISSNIAFALVLSLLFYTSPYILAFAGEVPLLPDPMFDVIGYVYAANVLAGIMIGMIGSYLAVIRFNRS